MHSTSINTDFYCSAFAKKKRVIFTSYTSPSLYMKKERSVSI